jgi:8-oxo-dGTP pyrophosphatase MutT (NUDIX family)
MNLRARVTRHLNAFPVRAVDHAALQLRHAAVAFTIVDDTFLLTRRTSRLRAHGGQIALPGGRVDDGESAENAALRELHEELGLRVDKADVLGRLDDYCTRSGYAITPVVVWADPDLPLTLNPDEVQSVHSFPLALLDSDDVPRLIDIPESDRPVIQVPLGEFGAVHAPTAAVLYQFREVCLHGRATRVDHFDQPVFAWK